MPLAPSDEYILSFLTHQIGPSEGMPVAEGMPSAQVQRSDGLLWDGFSKAPSNIDHAEQRKLRMFIIFIMLAVSFYRCVYTPKIRIFCFLFSVGKIDKSTVLLQPLFKNKINFT
jgi:hypothetical protein